VMNQGSIMRGLIDALIIERSRAGSKATGLHWGYRLLLVGLACISILGFLLGLHDAKLIGVQHAGRTVRPATACTRAVGAKCPAGEWSPIPRGRAVPLRQPEHRPGREGS
jgi:hypothetical protein